MGHTPGSPSIADRIPAPVLFLLGGTSMYVGAALAVGLFDRLAPSAVAELRLIGAALVLLAWRRPGRAAWAPRRLLRSAAFGLATALMNVAYYEAIARLPLGTAVAIEFCGPVAVAALASRRPRDVAAVVLAAAGVLLIADVRWSGSPSGVAWALAAAAMWALYIVLGKRVARGGNGIDDLAVGFAAAAVVLSPLLLTAGSGGGPEAGTRDGLVALAEPGILLLAVGLGVLSSVVPYVLDQVVLRRVGQARFAVLLALLPATATLVGLIGLGQRPGLLEAVGIAAVIVAVTLRSRDGDEPPSGPGSSRSVTESRSAQDRSSGWDVAHEPPGTTSAPRTDPS
ncbi:inner membrane transporter RhtA [Pseudonocardia sediminis]|uniref:Inner membrane transporter RhtA n=1 Tax=Pseudonocardia sediminis TaxID=1397368 RepID=A0A4Q7UU46_PSEST|nr:EamA family transporter [Pseudonocardia sediminis]RZT85372.1 inner membrane transporter RhtA [Pseudonocardia sediminis]